MKLLRGKSWLQHFLVNLKSVHTAGFFIHPFTWSKIATQILERLEWLYCILKASPHHSIPSFKRKFFILFYLCSTCALPVLYLCSTRAQVERRSKMALKSTKVSFWIVFYIKGAEDWSSRWDFFALKFLLSQPNNNHNPNNKTTITVVGLRQSNHWEHHHPHNKSCSTTCVDPKIVF